MVFPHILALAVTVFGVQPWECKGREDKQEVAATKVLGLDFHDMVNYLPKEAELEVN